MAIPNPTSTHVTHRLLDVLGAYHRDQDQHGHGGEPQRAEYDEAANKASPLSACFPFEGLNGTEKENRKQHQTDEDQKICRGGVQGVRLGVVVIA